MTDWLSELMNKKSFWLSYRCDSEALLTSVEKSSKVIPTAPRCNAILMFVSIDGYSSYSLFVDIIQGLAEACWSGSNRLNVFFDFNNVKSKKLLQNLINEIVVYFPIDFKINYIGLDYLNGNDYTRVYDSYIIKYKKYKNACDLPYESKVCSIAKTLNVGKIFIVQKKKTGRLLRRFSIPVIAPIITKKLSENNLCPQYAKLPPAGFCIKGILSVFFRINSIYECQCNSTHDVLYKVDLIWYKYKKDLHSICHSSVCLNQNNEKTIKITFCSFKEASNSAVVLFGAPTIGVANHTLILLATGNMNKPSIVIEDTMGIFLYDKKTYNKNEIHSLYNQYKKLGIDVYFNSIAPDFPVLAKKWLEVLKVSDLLKIRNNAHLCVSYPLNVYEAMHLAIMGATYEQHADNTIYMHAYNESAYHIFNHYMNKEANYILCHRLPDNNIRIDKENISTYLFNPEKIFDCIGEYVLVFNKSHMCSLTDYIKRDLTCWQ